MQLIEWLKILKLWTYNLYENNLLTIELEASSGPKKEGHKTTKITNIDYKEYDLNYHLNKTSENLRQVFSDIREQILELNDVEEKVAQKSGITYRTTKSFTRFEFNKNSIDLLLRQPKYEDPLGLIKDITSFGWGYKGLVKVTGIEDTDYLFGLIKQSYEETL